MRCRDGRRLTTIDELVLDGLDQCAVFGPGHTSRPQGDDVTIYNGDNEAVANFPNGASKYRFLSSTGGHLGVFKLPPATVEATRDEDRLVQLRDALVRLNQQNAEFWQNRNEE
jgi:hypothetical protein